MFRKLKSESGAAFVIAAAMVMVVVSAVSSWALVSMVADAELMTHLDHDSIQEELLLRSEARRTHLAIEHNNTLTPPGRIVTIKDVNGKRDTRYEIKNKIERKHVTIWLGQATEQVLAVKSLITSTRKYTLGDKFDSPVKRMTERLIRNESLAQYQYFTDIEASENSENGPDVVRFYGADVLTGPVHSNDDIWIRNLGGWPTFLDKVTTAKRIRVYPSGDLAINAAPVNQIFLGGFEEEVPPILFQPDASELQQNAYHVGYGQDIVYVKLNGNSMQTMYGSINFLGNQDFEVYSWYPHNATSANQITNAGGNWFEDSDNIWTNNIAMYDTVWSPGPAFTVSPSGSSFYVPDGELWIEGVVSGKVTWGCANRVYIVGDITYGNTDPGLPPDDEDNPNPTDFFGLVSEERMLIQYKHYDPFQDNALRTGNCNDIYLYGAYAAIGNGDPELYGIYNCHYDGIFSFEYQHPHGSTPHFNALSPYTLDDTLFTYIDLHKFIYPVNSYLPPSLLGFNLHGGPPPPGYNVCGFPYELPGYITSYPNNAPYQYPYGTDYPWYNPIWPESQTSIVFLRGNINNWGAIAQRRRGFVRRSGSDEYNHPPGNNNWELDTFTFHYDGTHPPTGYDKNYNYDKRFLVIQPPDYPQIYEGWGDTSVATFNKRSWVFKSPNEW